MKKIFTILLIIFLFQANSLFGQAASVTLGHHNKFPGQVIIPITVTGFVNITSITISFSYDSTVLVYSGYQNFGFMGSVVLAATPVPNTGLKQIVISWYAPNAPQSVSGNLIQIKFNYAGDHSNLTFGLIEVSDANSEPISVTPVNGSISPPAQVSLGELHNQLSGSVLLPLNVDFSVVHAGVGEFQFVFEYDNNILDINGLENTTLSGIQSAMTSPGQLSITWNGAATQFTGKLLDLDITYKSGYSVLSFLQTSCFVKNINSLALSVIYTNGFIDGLISLSLSTLTAQTSQIDLCFQFAGNIAVKRFFRRKLPASAGNISMETTLGFLSAVIDHNDGTYTAMLWPDAPYVEGIATVKAIFYENYFEQEAEITFLPAPEIIFPENIQSANDEGLCGASILFAADFTGSPTPVFTYTLNDSAIESPNFFPSGNSSVLVKADYGCGIITDSFTVQVNNNEPPVPPDNETVTVNCPSEAIQPLAPIAMDNCDGSVQGTILNIINQPDPLVCSGQRHFIFSYTDVSGNTSTSTFSYMILPTTNPVLIDPETSCSTLDQTGLEWPLEEAEAFNAAILEEDVATLYRDNCSGEVTAILMNIIPGENNSNQSWIFTYEFEISDVCGNTVLCYVEYSGSIVPENIELSGLIMDDLRCYGATRSIQAQELTILPGGNITFIAGQSILLLPDISVQSNGYLHAYISEIFCENPTPLVAHKETIFSQEPSLGLATFNNSVKIYPNPSAHDFTVDLNEDQILNHLKVELFNLMGTRIGAFDYDGQQQFNIDLSSYPKGIYLLKVNNGKETATFKLIKQ